MHSNLENLCLIYYDDIMRYSMSLSRDRDLAQDITQETFLKALKSLHQLKDPAKIKTWLFTIARNLFITRVRQNNRYHTAPLEDLFADMMDTKVFTPEQQYIIKEGTEVLQKMIRKLTEEEQQIFELKVQQKYSFDEISESLNMKASTARVKFHRLRIKLINLIKEGENFE